MIICWFLIGRIRGAEMKRIRNTAYGREGKGHIMVFFLDERSVCFKMSCMQGLRDIYRRDGMI